MVRGQRSLLALSSRPWLGYSDQGRFNISPLSYEPLSYASGEGEGRGSQGRGGHCEGRGGISGEGGTSLHSPNSLRLGRSWVHQRKAGCPP